MTPCAPRRVYGSCGICLLLAAAATVRGGGEVAR
jgi:hypothetical protein